MYNMHNAEVNFYTKIQPLLHNELYYISPDIYAARECPAVDNIRGGFLLMEDLGSEPIAIPLHVGLNKEQIESAIKAIAEFHASTLALPKGLVESFPMRQKLSLPVSV